MDILLLSGLLRLILWLAWWFFPIIRMPVNQSIFLPPLSTAENLISTHDVMH
jgi:hypothetical protein